ncbi:hypothetical protein V2J09_009864 [Rumex salicifolius]
MSDDLFKDCDCGDCGDCGDCDCCDCDCNCDDCFPDNNVIVICCCFPPASNNNQSNKTNRASRSPDCFPCCCCCEGRSPQQRRRQRRKNQKKKGFCCWRLWCCFVRNDPSPAPSPPRPGPNELSPRSYYRRDGRYPMDDPDLYMNDRWERHNEELDMPPRGYKSGGRYPMRANMGMYRDELYGRGAEWNGPRGMRRDYRRDDRRDVRGMPLREDQRNNEEYARPVELDLPPKDSHGSREDKPPEDYGNYRHQGHSEVAQQGHKFEAEWSRPVKYEETDSTNQRLN